jgi:hypothetical protein
VKGVTTIKVTNAVVWVMPIGAETLEVDGRQLFYGTEDGLGSTVSIGTAEEIELETAYGQVSLIGVPEEDVRRPPTP